MFTTIYIEEAIAGHPRTRDILDRFPKATRVTCRHYGEVFNPKAQNFRLQKQRPALILAAKQDGFVLPAPAGYGIGGRHNYYFSHMLNCLYDCRYCFLQGMYRSAHYVLYVNYEDYFEAIGATLDKHLPEPSWFFSGYDCDSLAAEPVSRFVESFLPWFSDHPAAHLELRTKSTQIRGLLKADAIPNGVVAFSFTPQQISEQLEHRVPTLERRLDAMRQLTRHGWQIGLRFDPMIYYEDYQQGYRHLFKLVFNALDIDSIHSVSLGTFRLPTGFFRNMVRLFPDEPLFAGPLEKAGGMVSYRTDLEQAMTDFCTEELQRYIQPAQFFPCTIPA